MNARTRPFMSVVDVRAEMNRQGLAEHWLAGRIGMPLAQLQRVLDPSSPHTFTEEEFAAIMRALGLPTQLEPATTQEAFA